MQALRAETEANAAQFLAQVAKSFESGFATISSHHNFLVRCYQRAVSLQAWRISITEPTFAAGAGAFFKEAQNDALMAIALAAHGLWRPALQSLRAVIEGSLSANYYTSHPVELELWLVGKFRQGFTDYCTYFEKHPRVFPFLDHLPAIAHLKREYAQLSMAVHGSSLSYWMTKHGFPNISQAEVKPLAMFAKRYFATINAINILMLMLFAEHLQGTKNRPLRKAISLAVTPKQSSSVKAQLGVNLFS